MRDKKLDKKNKELKFRRWMSKSNMGQNTGNRWVKYSSSDEQFEYSYDGGKLK